MLRYSVLLVSLAINSPVLWAALYTQTTPLETAGVRYLLTIPVVAILLGLVRMAMSPAPPNADEHVATSGNATASSERR